MKNFWLNFLIVLVLLVQNSQGSKQNVSKMWMYFFSGAPCIGASHTIGWSLFQKNIWIQNTKSLGLGIWSKTTPEFFFTVPSKKRSFKPIHFYETISLLKNIEVKKNKDKSLGAMWSLNGNLNNGSPKNSIIGHFLFFEGRVKK